ncbi:MAG: hypothetical protein ABIG93_04890 [archaeon]|nr:hypothetical protein [Nanoarchaeota archaeon]
MKKIILDTNAFMAISEMGLDIFSAINEACNFKYKLFVLQGTVKELEMIVQEQRGRFKQGAKLALTLLKKKLENCELEIMNNPIPEKYVDDNLVILSKEGYLVLTQDVVLKRKLTKPYLTIRQKKKVMVVE